MTDREFMEKNFEQMNRKFDQIEKNFGQVNRRLDGMDNDIKGIKETLNNAITLFDNEIVEIKKKIS